MDARADRRGVPLLDAAKLHGGLGHRDALDPGHLAVGGQQQFQLAVERNGKRVLDEGILPGVDVGLLGRHDHVMALGQRGGARDGYGARGAGLDAFARQPIGGSEAPGAVGEGAHADAERFLLGKRAHLPIFCGEIAQADVHHPRVGEAGAAHTRRFKRQIGPFLHQDWP